MPVDFASKSNRILYVGLHRIDVDTAKAKHGDITGKTLFVIEGVITATVGNDTNKVGDRVAYVCTIDVPVNGGHVTQALLGRTLAEQIVKIVPKSWPMLEHALRYSNEDRSISIDPPQSIEINVSTVRIAGRDCSFHTFNK